MLGKRCCQHAGTQSHSRLQAVARPWGTFPTEGQQDRAAGVEARKLSRDPQEACTLCVQPSFMAVMCDLLWQGQSTVLECTSLVGGSRSGDHAHVK